MVPASWLFLELHLLCPSRKLKFGLPKADEFRAGPEFPPVASLDPTAESSGRSPPQHGSLSHVQDGRGFTEFEARFRVDGRYSVRHLNLYSIRTKLEYFNAKIIIIPQIQFFF